MVGVQGQCGHETFLSMFVRKFRVNTVLRQRDLVYCRSELMPFASSGNDCCCPNSVFLRLVD
jgi:hypothetical protein